MYSIIGIIPMYMSAKDSEVVKARKMIEKVNNKW